MKRFAAIVGVVLFCAAAAPFFAGCAHGDRSGPDSLTITTASLPAGVVGQPYSGKVEATRSKGPYNFAWGVDAGSLPDGLSLSQVSGDIVGTPTKAGTFTFVVKCVDTGPSVPQQATKALSITVSGAGSALTITTITLGAGVVGEAYSASLTATGGNLPYTWGLDSGSPSLPPGIQLSLGGHLTGTPTTEGTYSFVVKVTDSTTPTAIYDTQALSIVIGPLGELTILTTTLPKGTVGVSYPSTVLQAAGGAGSYSWELSSGLLPDGLSLSATGTVSGTPQRSGVWNFTVRVTDGTASDTQSLSITVDPSSAVTITTASLPDGQVGISYVQTLGAGGGTSPYIWSLDSGTLPSGLSLSSLGNLTGVPTVSGDWSFVIKVTDSTDPTEGVAVAGFSIHIDPNGIVTVQTNSLSDGVQNKSYTQTVTAIGGTPGYTWSIYNGTLPPGITLNVSTGEISGTATNAGTWSFVVKAEDNTTPEKLSGLKTLSIEIIPELRITTEQTGIMDGATNAAYGPLGLSAQGGLPPYTWAMDTGSSDLPAGLELTNGGHLVGTVTAAVDTYSFAIRVTDSSSPQLYATKAFVVNIKTVTIIPQTLPAAQEGQLYDVILEARGGVVTAGIGYIWMPSGSLPMGLGLQPIVGEDRKIRLAGTPAAGTAGTYTFDITAEEDGGEIDGQTFTLTVNPP